MVFASILSFNYFHFIPLILCLPPHPASMEACKEGNSRLEMT